MNPVIELRNKLLKGELDGLTVEQITMAREIIKGGRIEILLNPSEHPSQDFGPPNRGASPKQLELSDAFWDKTHRIYAAAGANQSGKTEAIGGMMFCRHLRERAKDGDSYWVLAQTWQTLRDIPMKTIWECLPRSMFGDAEYNPKTGFGMDKTLILHLPEGRGKCELWFWQEEQSKNVIESARLAGCWWTECMDSFIWHSIQPRFVAKGGFLVMDYVPKLGWHEFDVEIPSYDPDSIIKFQRFCIEDNIHNIGMEKYLDLKPKSLGGRGVMSVEQWRVRGEGKNAASFGVVYRQFDRQEHCIDPFKLPDYWPIYLWADWGYRNPHAFAFATVAPNGNKYVFDEQYDTEMSVRDVCLALFKKLRSYRPVDLGQFEDEGELFDAVDRERKEAEYTKEFRYPLRDTLRAMWLRMMSRACVIDASIFNRDQADGRCLGDVFAEYGFPVTGSIKRDKDGGVEMVRRHFEQRRLFFFKHCYHTIRDHASWRYKEDKQGDAAPDDKYERKNDHACAAVMYGLRSNPTHEVESLTHRGNDDA